MIQALTLSLGGLRAGLDRAFAEDTTALDGDRRMWRSMTPSAGHCAVVAILVRSLYGGDFMSAKVNGESHWFNSIPINGALYEADLTGDQFGYRRVRVTRVDGEERSLFPDSRVRNVDEINAETWRRHRLLVERLEAP